MIARLAELTGARNPGRADQASTGALGRWSKINRGAQPVHRRTAIVGAVAVAVTELP